MLLGHNSSSKHRYTYQDPQFKLLEPSFRRVHSVLGEFPNRKPWISQNHNPPVEGRQWAKRTRHTMCACNPRFGESTRSWEKFQVVNAGKVKLATLL